MSQYIKPKKNNHVSLIESYLNTIRKSHDTLIKEGKYKQVLQMYMDLEHERCKLHYVSILPLNISYSPEIRIGTKGHEHSIKD